MRNLLNNKKGFTLVELLAVIVILALIMSIAIISMTGIMQGARYSTMKETGLQIINGVRQQLTLSNKLPSEAGDTKYYYFTESLLDKGGKESPLGGEFKYSDGGSGTKIGYAGVYEASGTLTCGNTESNQQSYVKVEGQGNGKSPIFSICLVTKNTGEYYINEATESELFKNDNDANGKITK